MSKRIFKGTPISQGVGIGGIYVCKSPEIKINKEKIDKHKIEDEITNLEVAVCRTYVEIYDLYNGFSDKLTPEETRILDVYNAVLDDLYFFEDMKSAVSNDLITAENAIDFCINRIINDIENSDNDYAKQRISDLNDIKNRLIRNSITKAPIINMDEIKSSHIVIIKEMNPTLAVTLGKKKVAAIVVQEGAGYLSHAAIILRGMSIPILNDIDFSQIEQFDGYLAVVDGFAGDIIIDPDDTEIEKYKELFNIDMKKKQELSDESNQPAETKDKHKVGLSVNISNFSDYKNIKNKNVDGVGLVRTETLFINKKSFPDESRQAVVYSAIVKGLNNKHVVLRTLDVGGDKSPVCQISVDELKNHKNRGIRYSLNHMEDFEAQIRAIVKASCKGDSRISFPMIETAEEMILCREIVKKQTLKLMNTYKDVKHIKVGAVIETKSAVNEIDEIINHLDFISIGTNDLLNQVMGLNRSCLGNEIMEYFDPIFIGVLQKIISAATKRSIGVSICGEMASDPMATAVLIGLGANDLSVAPASIALIKRTIRDLSYEESKRIVERILKCSSSCEVKDILKGKQA